MDREAWYSTTPKVIAEHQARVCRTRVSDEDVDREQIVVLDAFCGAGGNSIAFAKAGYKVIACDTDSEKLKMVSDVFLTLIRRIE